MANVICHICLHTDITAVKLSTELTDFIDELCDYNIIDNPRYKYCTICAHLLKKFYNFKQQCLKACKILKSLKGRPKVLPTNLHEQIPSSIELCSSIARYKVLEHQQHTDIDLLETKPDLSIEPNIKPNNAEAYTKQNLEIADPTLPGCIEVKCEPMHDVLDSDIETMQVADGKNIYNITTSNGYLTIDSNFEKETKSIKLEANTDELNTNTNENGSKDNAKHSKINDFLKGLEEEIKEFEDNSVDADDIEVKDTTNMLNNDPLKDDESLNSKDDIESDISDCDVESQPMDEQNSESDSDSLSEIIEKAKDKKININEIYDLELAEILLKVDRKNKLLERRVQFLKDKRSIKDGVLKWFENDEYDLDDGLKISKEVFLKIYERCERSPVYHFNTYNFKDTLDKKKTGEFLHTLYKMYNPEYATVFDIGHLDTEEKKLQAKHEDIAKLNFSMEQHSSVVTTQLTIDDTINESSVTFKDEPIWLNEEVTIEEDTLMKVESVSPEYCTKIESSLEDDSVLGNCERELPPRTCVEQNKPFECNLCNKQFSLQCTLVRHLRSHTVEKPFTCNVCDIQFKHKFALVRHKIVHTFEKPFTCNICDKQFKQKFGLVRHKIIHTGEKRFTCNVCGKQFSQKDHLVNHLRIHTGDKPYACNLCDKTFNQKSALLRHTIIHTGKKPFACNTCNKQFGVKNKLVVHMRTHTGEKPYACNLCDKKFKCKSTLVSHNDSHW